MATADQYADWIVQNQDKKGSPEFDTVAQAYKLARSSPKAEPAEDHGMLKNIGMGALKGASDIGSTLLYPVDKVTDLVNGDRGQNLSSLITGQKTLSRNEERRQQLGDFFKQNANPDSLAFKGGELGADIAGTAGAGGVLAKVARTAGAAIPAISPYVPKLAAALESGGFSLGGAPAATGMEILKNAGTRIAGGAISGGAQAGLIDPSTTGTGALIGGALPVVGAVAGEAGRAVKAGIYDPIANQQQLISSALLRAVGRNNAPTVAANIGRQAATPGVRFSAGEASGDAALAAIEDSLKAGNAGGALNRQAGVNRTALADSLRGMTGSDGERAFHEASRAATADSLYKEAYAAGVDLRRDATTGQFLTKASQSARKGEITKLMQTPSMQEAAKDARALMLDDPNLRGKVLDPAGSVQGLDYTRRALSDMIGKAEGNKQRILIGLRNRLDTTLDTISPKYAEARKTFAEMGKPINQMDVARSAADKLIPATSGDIPTSLNAASLAKALRDPDVFAQQATGFNGARFDKIMTPEQAAAITGVSGDASRIAEMNKLGAGYGSPTFRRQATSGYVGQNFAEKAPVISRALEALGNVPGIHYLSRGLSGLGNMAGKGINAKVAARLEDMLAADPQGTARALQEALIASNRQVNGRLSPQAQSLLKSIPLLANQANP